MIGATLSFQCGVEGSEEVRRCADFQARPKRAGELPNFVFYLSTLTHLVCIPMNELRRQEGLLFEQIISNQVGTYWLRHLDAGKEHRRGREKNMFFRIQVRNFEKYRTFD